MTESVYKLEIFLPEDHFDPICQALWTRATSGPMTGACPGAG